MPHADSMHNHHEHDNEGHGSNHGPGYLPTREEFEERYAQSQQIWSGHVNATLVDEVADLRPGTALDVGCGEGADLQWLTDRGWEALGIDFAPTAVQRCLDRGLHAEVADYNEFEHEPFDLVSVHYGGVPATEEGVAKLETLTGDVLVFVHHDLESDAVAMPAWLAENLKELEVVKLDKRERRVEGGAGAHHSHDVVLVAKRRTEAAG